MKIGDRLEMTFPVTDKDTAKAVGSGGAEVLATPQMIAFMEQVAYRCVQDKMEQGKTTVGTLVSIQHLDATPVGMQVTVSAQITGIDGRKIDFILEAHDEKALIGKGEHSRFIVTADSFQTKANSKLL